MKTNCFYATYNHRMTKQLNENLIDVKKIRERKIYTKLLKIFLKSRHKRVRYDQMKVNIKSMGARTRRGYFVNVEKLLIQKTAFPHTR